ncbi:NAD-dependent epimerase/dehydratase family protein [Micromonospora sp. LOL_023]|uniref:NAD-dependent epimerase/dehydratase family protein n=1 Tax=Micromonospora sp. LOL_023 TaxID=3345418 RepID=UPI003A86E634
MNVFVVGGSGVLGQQLVPMLLENACRVTVMAPGARLRHLPTGVETVPASLVGPETAELLRGRLAGEHVVVNLASAIPADPRAPGGWELNSRLRRYGTRVLVEAVRAAGVPQLVQMSITMAYADGGDRWLDESAPFDSDPARVGLVQPVTEMESIVTRLDPSEVRWTVLRGGRFVGPGTGQDAQQTALRAGRLSVAGSGQSFMSMVHVRDYAAAVVAAVRVGPAGLVCNVTAEPVRQAEYLDVLAHLVGAARPASDPIAAPDLPSQRVSSDRARRELGWQARHGVWPDGGW